MYEKDINLQGIVVMKKISLLLAAILASVTVSGCDAFTSFFGGDSSKPQDQQKSDDYSKKEDNGNSEPWEQEEQESDYAVAFNNNEGSGYMAIQTTDGSEFVVPECTFTRTGYHFIKWGLLVNEEWTYYFVGDKITGIKSDIILYAIWEEDSAVSYTVSFNNNGGTGVMENQTTIGSTYKTPSCTFTKTEYEFSKWALNSPSGQQYAVGSIIDNITGNIVLYAVWKEQSYTVTLYANNGTSTSSTATTNGFTYTTPSCSFSYSGHSFDGWAFGSPSGTKYSANQQITNIHENISLYATWKESGSDPFNGYYDAAEGVADNKLLETLNSIINTNNVDVSYAWSRYEAADEDPNNTNNVLLIYSRISMLKSQQDSGTNAYVWNREHTFPQSKMSNSQSKNDNHIIYASEKKVNGTRSSKKMGVVDGGSIVYDFNNKATTCRTTDSLFDPHNLSRGIVARTTMYAAAMYDFDPEDNFESIETMLRWHFEYWPDENDMRRNNVVYSNQHNRNPFVDHPEYACKIWGTTNSQTRSICGM